MERTRDVSPKSIADFDVRSVTTSSTNSQSCDRKNVKTLVDDNPTMLSLILEAINETIAEKNSRGDEISELLKNLDIDVKSMPKDIQDSWTKAAAIMRAEDLSSLDSTILTLHMRRKQRETMKKIREERKLKTRYDMVQDGQTKVLEETNRLRESVNELRKAVKDGTEDGERQVNRMVNAAKLNDYRKIVEKTEDTLNELRANEYLPEKILSKYNDYLELREELNAAERSLSKYSDLPPNLTEARAQLADREEYLKALEHEIFEKMK